MDLVGAMGGRRVVFLYMVCVLVVVCGLHGMEAEVLSEARCDELGFTGMALCSDCDSLGEYVKDKGSESGLFESIEEQPVMQGISAKDSDSPSAELEADCRKCCAEESENAVSKMKYARAVLEICLRKVMFYPNIQTFIDEKLTDFPEVDVKYRFGAPPKLIMKDEKGDLKESIRIDNWKTEQIEQFLTQKVISKASL